MPGHVPRVFSDQPLKVGATIRLEGEPAHHLLRVLRMAPGDALVLLDGNGAEYRACVAAVGKHSLDAQLFSRHDVQSESPLRVTLVQGVSRGERMDYTIQKAVELGVTAIQPVEALRSVARLDGERAERRLRHWREIARSAAEQCGRASIPAVADIHPLREWLAQRDTTRSGLLLAPESGRSLREMPAQREVDLLVGPEGGLDPTETDQALESGFSALRLGPRILRTETAGVACLAAMQALWGDF